MESAIELAWTMSTLLPPSSACKPTVYHQEWQELVATSDSTVNPETDTDYKLVYCRPVLFFGAEGTVGKPGAVKCLLVEPLPLQTTGDGANNGEQPLLSRLDSSSNENQLEESGSLHKLAEASHRESTTLTPEAGGRILSSPSEATSSHVSTTDKQNGTSAYNDGSDGANRNLQATCKSTTKEEVDKSKVTQPVSDTGEHATNPDNPIQTQLSSNAPNSDATQFSDDRFSSSTYKPNNSGTATDLPTVDFSQGFDMMQKYQSASINSGVSLEKLTAQQPSDAISAAKQGIPCKEFLSQSRTNNPAVYGDGQLSVTAYTLNLQLQKKISGQPLFSHQPVKKS